MQRTYEPGGILQTEPASKGITVWHIDSVIPDMAWGHRPDGLLWEQEPIENLVVLAYFPPE